MKTMKMFMMAMMMTIATSAMASTTTNPRNDRNRHDPATCVIDHQSPKYKDLNYCPMCGVDLNKSVPPAPKDKKVSKKQPVKQTRSTRSFGNAQSRSFGGRR